MRRQGIAKIFDKAELTYLNMLRWVVLITASILILTSAIFIIISAFNTMRSPDSIKEESVAVSKEDVVKSDNAHDDGTLTKNSEAEISKEKNRRIAQFRSVSQRLYSTFKTNFAPYRRNGDEIITPDQFDEKYVQSNTRMNQAEESKYNFDQDIDDLNKLSTVISDAALDPTVVKKLKNYQSATIVNECRNVEKTKNIVKKVYDPESIACPNWYSFPRGCVIDKVTQEKYTEKECANKLSNGAVSFEVVFSDLVDRYWATLKSKREAAAAEADKKRAEIVAGKALAKMLTPLAGQLFIGFLSVMFIFVFIAIERHLRIISKKSDSTAADSVRN